MQSADILQTIAEVSIAFAGFTSVVAVLGRRSSGEWTEIDRFRLSEMLSSSLAALLFALLPLLLTQLRLSEGMSWAIASALLAAYLVFQLVSGSRRVRRLPLPERTQTIRPLLRIIPIIVAGVVVSLLLNVPGIFFQREPGPFLLGLYWLLAFSAFQFTRLLLVIQPGSGSDGGGA